MYPYNIFLGMNLYSIFFVFAILVSLFVCDKLMSYRNFTIALQKIVIVAFLVCIIFAFIFAILFQAFYDFIETGIFKIDNTTGFTFFGGLLGGGISFMAVWFVGGKLFLKNEAKGEEKKKFVDMLEIASCVIPLGHGIGRIGCFFAGCCHGKPTNEWFGVNMLTENGWQKVVPIQLFETIFLFVLSGVLLFLFLKKNMPLLSIYSGGYGIWRFIIEYFRDDNRGATIVQFLTPSQLISLCLIIFSFIYLIFYLKNKQKS